MSEPFPPPTDQNPGRRPTLRCPACSFMVPLPAESCAKCGANLRTGEMPRSEEPPSNRPKIIVGILALLVIISLAVFILGGIMDEPEPVPQAAPKNHNAGDVGEAVDIFHDLQDQSLGATPGIILDRSKNTAEQVEENRRNMDEIFLSTEQGSRRLLIP